MTAFTAPCPICATGRISLITDGLVGVRTIPAQGIRGAALPMRMENRPFVACSECEFCSEVELGDSGVLMRVTQ